MKLSYLNTLINELERIGYPTKRLHVLPSVMSKPWRSDIYIQTSTGEKLINQENGKISLDAVLKRVPLKTLKLVGIDVNLYCASSLKLFDKVPSRANALVNRHNTILI